ncbi:HEPN domain-containing protein [Actinoplanes sp. NPDC051851]|uniref:HEPN domain-containing protein n=1 Tax=Actinoplanes sp. NPDC051851 TaxID=3154753 RepID=UPI00343633A6
MTSLRFDELQQRLEDLRRHFLPVEFDETGTYDDVVYEHARAFRVLSHAEFEAFIEDRALYVLNEDFRRWEDSGVTSLSLLAAVAFRESVHAMPESLNDAIQNKRKYPSLEDRIKAAKNDFSTYVRTRNHGIREKNLIKLLMPLGFSEIDLDITWVAATDAWAMERGKVAHASGKMQVRPDPQVEWKTVNTILKGFRDIDEMMSRRIN